jgi:hypothetical protein
MLGNYRATGASDMLRRRLAELVLAASAALIAGNAAAQSAPPARPCAAPEHRAMDFWVGEWRVTWKQNEKPMEGRNSIKQVLGGCALEENWRGGGGGEGKSLTFYDRTKKQWHQTWIDGSGQPLYLDGNFEGKSLVLTGKVGQGKELLYQRIMWTPLPDGLRQPWKQSKDGKEWQTLFDGRYEPLR